MLTNYELQQVQTLLLKWFNRNKRDFPWRTTRDPYQILIAEKLLQQTIARDNVIKAYESIITQYPTVKEMSIASIRDIEKIIQPLGLIYRAKELIVLSKEIVQKHQGNIPNNLNSLLSLFGIGDYSARAILSFAFDEDVPVVDINVARFISRFFGLSDAIPQNPARNKQIRELAKSLLPQGKSRKFNLAIIDLSALVCKTRVPECVACPLKGKCVFYETTINKTS